MTEQIGFPRARRRAAMSRRRRHPILRFLASLALLTALTAGVASASTVRALFVGINDYKSKDGSKGIDLHGSVNDVMLVRQTLADAKLMAPDPFDPAKGCRSDSPVSPTLINFCATRQNIIDAWTRLIGISAPGDTLIFYYSGHGSNTGATAFAVEGGQPMDTIVPTDARGPDGAGDLLGGQVKMLIDAATERGRNVVTIFDSCDSGAADRDIGHEPARRVREIAAPPADALAPGDPDLSALSPPTGAARGYAVHLSATNRAEVAVEKSWDGAVDGNFTKALADAISKNPTARYADLAGGALDWLTRHKVDQQHPQAEGATLAAFLESGADPGQIYPARWDGQALTARAGLAADAPVVGRLGGVTSGSTFKVYAAAGDAVRDTGAVGQATVDAGAAPTTARLTLVGAASGLKTGTLLWLREINHDFGGAAVRLRVSGAPLSPQARAKLDAMNLLNDRLGPGDAADFELALGDQTHAKLWRVDGGARALAVDIDKMSGDDPTARMIEAVRRVANYRALRDLTGAAPTPLGGLWTQGPCDDAATQCSSSVFGRSADNARCQPGPPALRASQTGAAPGTAIMPPTARFEIWARNLSCRDLHPYIFYLGRDYSITLLYPPSGSAEWVLKDKSQRIRTGHAVQPTGAGSAEIGRLVLLMTDTPIPAEALQQSGLPRGLDCNAGALAHLLCSARAGSRTLGSGGEALGQWSVSTLDIRVSGAP